MMVITPKAKKKGYSYVSPTQTKLGSNFASILRPHTWPTLYDSLNQMDFQFTTNVHDRESPTSMLNVDTVLIISTSTSYGRFPAKDVEKLLEIYQDQTIFAAFEGDLHLKHQHLHQYSIVDNGYLQATVAAIVNTRGAILVYMVGPGSGDFIVDNETETPPWLLHLDAKDNEVEVYPLHVLNLLANLCKTKQPPINTLMLEGKEVSSRMPAKGRNSVFPPRITVMLNFIGGNHFHSSPCPIVDLMLIAETLHVGKNVVHNELVAPPVVSGVVQGQVIQAAKQVAGFTKISAFSVVTSVIDFASSLEWNWQAVMLILIACVWVVFKAIYEPEQTRDHDSYYLATCFVLFFIIPFVWKFRYFAIGSVVCFFTATIGFGKMSGECGELLYHTSSRMEILANTSESLRTSTEMQFGSLVNLALNQKHKNVVIKFNNQSYMFMPVKSTQQCKFENNIINPNEGLTTSVLGEVWFVTCTHSVFQNTCMKRDDLHINIDSVRIEGRLYPLADTRNAVFKMIDAVGDETEQKELVRNVNKVVKNIRRPSAFKRCVVNMDWFVLMCKEFAKYFKKIIEGR